MLPQPPKPIGPHGGYENLKSYQMSEIIADATAAFCRRFIDPHSRTYDQMIQAARSGKQNIAEGSRASATSHEGELTLTNVARSSLEELLLDFLDFLRQRSLAAWPKDHSQAIATRRLARLPNRSYQTYRPHIERGTPEVAANTVICLIHQANYLLDQQLRQQQERFLAEGGFREALYRARLAAREAQRYRPPE